MTEIAIQIDEHNRDVLYARRVEMFFEPNEDGSPSTRGSVLWHTEWWHYSGDLLRGKSMGPRIERDVADILDEAFDDLPALAIIGAIKAAFIKHATEDLGLGAQEEPEE